MEVGTGPFFSMTTKGTDVKSNYERLVKARLQANCPLKETACAG